MCYRVVYNIERPREDTIAGLAEIPTAMLSDSLGRYFTMNHVMKPIWEGARLCGPAVTVKTFPGDNLMCHKSLEVVKPGDVLVIDAGGYADVSVWGGLLSLSAKVHQVGGVVIDGAARDVREVKGIGFPVFATSTVPRAGFKEKPGWINLPVVCAGVNVNPGDVVVGDQDGVVVIPKERAGGVLTTSKKRTHTEGRLSKEVSEGKLLLHLLGLEQYISKHKIEEIR